MFAKRCRGIAVILLLALLLCSCGKKDFDPQQVAEHYAQSGFSTQYTVTTHAGFYEEYQLCCEQQNDLSTVTILQPESVAGISAVLQEGDVKLQYEDLSLDALLPEAAGYAPMDVLHGLLEDLRAGDPENWGMESDLLTLEYKTTLTDGSETLKILTLQAETLDLLSAECYLDNSLILAVQVESWQWNS